MPSPSQLFAPVASGLRPVMMIFYYFGLKYFTSTACDTCKTSREITKFLL